MRLLGFLLLLLSCNQQEVSYTGKWQLEISLQDNKLPVSIELKQTGKNLTGSLFNSDETIPLEGEVFEDKALINIGAHYAELAVSSLSKSSLQGFWVRTNKENYQVPFTGKRVEVFKDYSKFETSTNALDISGKWKVQLKEDKLGLGVFEQKGSRVKGSILTSTGDYRYLDGYIENDLLTLTGFDGVFSFILKLRFKDDKFVGSMKAGKDYQAEISGVRDELFELEDPNAMTKLTSNKPIKLVLTDINGGTIDLDGEGYQNKAKIIQLFGSWCPNCIDETNFFVKWRMENKEKLNHIKFIALAFEKFSEKKLAIKALKKSAHKLAMDYPLVLVDFDKSTAPHDILPIDKGRAFPTTLYVDKNNKIIKVHTGFSGQATGPFFDSFVKDFNQTIDTLIKL